MFKFQDNFIDSFLVEMEASFFAFNCEVEKSQLEFEQMHREIMEEFGLIGV